MATSRKIGVAWKRRDKYNRGYIHMQVGEQGKVYHGEGPEHEPDYIACHVDQ